MKCLALDGLSSAVTFRDDNDALHARVEALEGELGAMRSKIARLEGGDDDVDAEWLPVLKKDWTRRTRVFRGELSPADQERMVQMMRAPGNEVSTSLVGRTLTLTSGVVSVVVTPGKGDEFVLVFDEVDHFPRRATSVFFAVIASLIALGVGTQGELTGAAFFVAIGVLGVAASVAGTRMGEKAAEARAELFSRLGTMIAERSTNVRVEEEMGDAIESLGHNTEETSERK